MVLGIRVLWHDGRFITIWKVTQSSRNTQYNIYSSLERKSIYVYSTAPFCLRVSFRNINSDERVLLSIYVDKINVDPFHTNTTMNFMTFPFCLSSLHFSSYKSLYIYTYTSLFISPFRYWLEMCRIKIVLIS